MAAGLQLLCLFAAVSLVWSDCYLHNPRGSNNRLNERSANRNNANRMFDSQNNNRGGYNAGERNTDQTPFSGEEEIYYMKYFQSGLNSPSFLTIEWTNQHGCGGNENDDTHKLNCNMVIQYMVMPGTAPEQPLEDNDIKLELIRNGENTQTQQFQNPQRDETMAAYTTRRNNNVDENRGMHETFDFYNDCYVRSRNRGLFTADQRLRSNNLGTSSAIYTRQNPNGNRRGYECPEERDYYPYWHPTPWRDIAVLVDNTSLCDFYRSESFNMQPRQYCREWYGDTPTIIRPFSEANTQADCEATETGVWYTEYAYIDIETGINQQTCEQRSNTDGYRRIWYPPKAGESDQCLVLPNAPDCQQVGWTRSNHLGNSRDGVPLNYTWQIPYFPSGENKLAVIRVRYNISTDDYDPRTTDSRSNENIIAGIRSPVTQNPYVDIGSTSNKPLRLAINTNQFGRTFQDRTHVMELRPRSMFLSNDAQTCTIMNLNVRGKRGNIVQVYPSVEYDFFPNRLTLNRSRSDCLHIQWTGSNTHNNGNPAGDGQAGDAGEGTGGTDRHNIVEIPEPGTNYPLPWEQANLFSDAEVLWNSWGIEPSDMDSVDTAVVFASAGYYGCYSASVCGANSMETSSEPLQQLLNNAPASFEGALLRFSRSGTYHYICSRNNNFTNRSQKGVIKVINS